MAIKLLVLFQIPKCAAVSAQCRDLLTRLLKHDPEQRIDYESFFKHDYLDLEHYPCEESLQKAIDLVSEAVRFDAEGKEREAFNLYCESLLYFVPLLNGKLFFGYLNLRKKQREMPLLELMMSAMIINIVFCPQLKLIQPKRQHIV